MTNATRPEEVPQTKKPSWQKGIYITTAAGLLIVLLAVLAIVFRERLIDFSSYGYLGVFLICILAGATIVVPIPGLAVVFVLGGILTPLFVGLAAGLGEAIGSLANYFLGYGGHQRVKGKYEQVFSRMEGWIKRRGALVIFLSSVVINPLFIFVGAAAGALRYPLWKFLLSCWAGKTLKGIAMAYLGHFGIRAILHWLGVTI